MILHKFHYECTQLYCCVLFRMSALVGVHWLQSIYFPAQHIFTMCALYSGIVFLNWVFHFFKLIVKGRSVAIFCVACLTLIAQNNFLSVWLCMKYNVFRQLVALFEAISFFSFFSSFPLLKKHEDVLYCNLYKYFFVKTLTFRQD